MVKGDGAAAKENQGKGERGQSEREFVAAVAHQSIVEVHLGDGYAQVDADREGSEASEQAQQHEEATQELGKGREIGSPGGQSKAGDQLRMVVKTTEDFGVSVADHDGAQSQAHDEECERLQAIEIAQVVPPGEKQHSTGVEGRAETFWLGRSVAPASTAAVDCLVELAAQKDCAIGELLVTFFRHRIWVARWRLVCDCIRVLRAYPPAHEIKLQPLV